MKSLKLNVLASEKLSGVEMNQVRGGANEKCCSCACAYANSGGSSTGGNANANYKDGLSSPGNKEDQRTICIEIG
jgi:natural product precursor